MALEELKARVDTYFAKKEEDRIRRLLGLRDDEVVCPATFERHLRKAPASTPGEKARADIEKMFGSGGDGWAITQGDSDEQESVPASAKATEERAVSPTLAADVAAYFGTTG
jgi:hypothetical protein